MKKAPTTSSQRANNQRQTSAFATVLASLFYNMSPAVAETLPEIRLSSANQVPTCVTPQRLMTFLRERHRTLPLKYASIADHYKKHGDAWHVRWDYAFFQMLHETNYLKFGGDVVPSQNNFAGLGTTGGGVRGDKFPDVSTGVLGQIHHLVAYSGEPVRKPAGRRTRLKQAAIIASSRKLRRPVRYSDLTMRWATDRKYHVHIGNIARRFTAAHCAATLPRKEAAKQTAPRLKALPRTITVARKVNVGSTPPHPIKKPDPAETSHNRRASKTGACRVLEASYGGTKTVLIKSRAGTQAHYTALTILEGYEQSMTDNYIAARTKGGRVIGTFKNQQEALRAAKKYCPAGHGEDPAGTNTASAS